VDEEAGQHGDGVPAQLPAQCAGVLHVQDLPGDKEDDPEGEVPGTVQRNDHLVSPSVPLVWPFFTVTFSEVLSGQHMLSARLRVLEFSQPADGKFSAFNS